jgi:hypothetical protein
MAAEEYGYTSPFGGPPVEIEVFESAAAPVDQMGADLMGFLTDFRTGQREINLPGPESTDDPDGSPAEAVRGQSRYEVHTKEPGEWIDPYAGSPHQMGPDWWQASDGKWYPGELHPDRQAVAATPVEPVDEPHPIDPTTAPDDAGGRKRRFSFGR